MLILTTLVAALATGAVVLTILSARGVGPFPQRDAADSTPTVLVAVEIAEIGNGAGTFGENLIDADPQTAWRATVADEPAVVLQLARRTAVTRLVVWNGDQREGAFATVGRVGRLRIETDERSFTVQLLDREGPQAIDLPDPVETERIRLVVLEALPEDQSEVALSEVEVYADA